MLLTTKKSCTPCQPSSVNRRMGHGSWLTAVWQMTTSRIPAPRPDPDHPAPIIVEPLSDREREVLRLLSAMLSTAEIGTEMYISVNTVKTHLRSIYRKLSAARRGEAVRRARELKLI